MRAEKKIISSEYVARLNSSPFFIVVDYTGLRVGPMTELRKRLQKAGAEIHVVKNTIFRIGWIPGWSNRGGHRTARRVGHREGIEDLCVGV